MYVKLKIVSIYHLRISEEHLQRSKKIEKHTTEALLKYFETIIIFTVKQFF